jgi:hypothetical protein
MVTRANIPSSGIAQLYALPMERGVKSLTMPISLPCFVFLTFAQFVWPLQSVTFGQRFSFAALYLKVIRHTVEEVGRDATDLRPVREIVSSYVSPDVVSAPTGVLIRDASPVPLWRFWAGRIRRRIALSKSRRHSGDH